VERNPARGNQKPGRDLREVSRPSLLEERRNDDEI
jgi:hypothetical protein